MRKLFILLSLVVLVAISGTVVAAARPTNVSVTITSSFDNDNKNLSHSVTSLPVGNSFQLNASNINSMYTFAFWVINGVVRDDLEATDLIKLQTSMHIQAVFHKSGEHAVLFVDSNGKLISTQYVANGGSVTAPSYAGLSKPGLEVNTVTPWKSLEGATTFDSINSSRVYVLQYTATVLPITLSITGGVATPANPNRNDVVTLVASDLPNFKYWKDQNGNVLSYNSTFVFTAIKDVTIIAENVTVKTPETLVTMSSDLAIRENYETYVGRFELEVGHELVEWGFLLSDETLGLISFATPNVIIAKSNSFNEATNEFVMSFSEVTYSSIRAYVIIDNGSSLEEIFSVPSAIASDLIISEYIEGSSSNKAIEIFNGTGQDIDLGLYNLVQYNNGSAAISYTLSLSGTILNGSTYVISNSSAALSGITSKTNLSTPSNVMGFNGNDAIAITLKSNNSIIDIVGFPGNSSNYAIDLTLTRKSSVLSPNSTYTESEWDTHSIDTTSYLGSHSLGSSTDSQKVVVDANGISLPSEIKSNSTLTLPSTGANGSTITWSSDTTNIITNAGVVTLPSGQPITVIMTATLTLNSVTKEVAFEITVGLTDLEKATLDRDAISITTSYTTATSATLPTMGANGSTISWESNDTLIVINGANATISMPVSGQVEVTLTASVSYGSVELTKEFDILLATDTSSGPTMFASYTFSHLTLKGTSMDATALKSAFDTGLNGTNKLTSITSVAQIYNGNASGGTYPSTAGLIKTGSSSNNGTFTLNFTDANITKVVIYIQSWTTSSTDTLSVNSGTAVSIPQSANQFLEFTFETSVNTVSFVTNRRSFIFRIDFYSNP